MRSFIIAFLFITYIAVECYANYSKGSADGDTDDDVDNDIDTSSKRSSGVENEITLGRSAFGTWGSEFRCRDGKYINRFRLKVDRPLYGRDKDNTGLLTLKVKCNDGQEGTSKEYTGKTPGAGWKPNHYTWNQCRDGTVVTGFNVASVPYQGYGLRWSGDDFAAVDVDMWCSDGKYLKGDSASGSRGWPSDAKWDDKCTGSPKKCSCNPNTSLCGIKTMVEDYVAPVKYQQTFDNTAVDKITFICCPNGNNKRNLTKQN